MALAVIALLCGTACASAQPTAPDAASAVAVVAAATVQAAAPDVTAAAAAGAIPLLVQAAAGVAAVGAAGVQAVRRARQASDDDDVNDDRMHARPSNRADAANGTRGRSARRRFWEDWETDEYDGGMRPPSIDPPTYATRRAGYAADWCNRSRPVGNPRDTVPTVDARKLHLAGDFVLDMLPHFAAWHHRVIAHLVHSMSMAQVNELARLPAVRAAHVAARYLNAVRGSDADHRTVLSFWVGGDIDSARPAWTAWWNRRDGEPGAPHYFVDCCDALGIVATLHESQAVCYSPNLRYTHKNDDFQDVVVYDRHGSVLDMFAPIGDTNVVLVSKPGLTPDQVRAFFVTVGLRCDETAGRLTESSATLTAPETPGDPHDFARWPQLHMPYLDELAIAISMLCPRMIGNDDPPGHEHMATSGALSGRAINTIMAYRCRTWSLFESIRRCEFGPLADLLTIAGRSRKAVVLELMWESDPPLLGRRDGMSIGLVHTRDLRWFACDRVAIAIRDFVIGHPTALTSSSASGVEVPQADAADLAAAVASSDSGIDNSSDCALQVIVRASIPGDSRAAHLSRGQEQIKAARVAFGAWITLLPGMEEHSTASLAAGPCLQRIAHHCGAAAGDYAYLADPQSDSTCEEWLRTADFTRLIGAGPDGEGPHATTWDHDGLDDFGENPPRLQLPLPRVSDDDLAATDRQRLLRENVEGHPGPAPAATDAAPSAPAIATTTAAAARTAQQQQQQQQQPVRSDVAVTAKAVSAIPKRSTTPPPPQRFTVEQSTNDRKVFDWCSVNLHSASPGQILHATFIEASPLSGTVLVKATITLIEKQDKNVSRRGAGAGGRRTPGATSAQWTATLRRAASATTATAPAEESIKFPDDPEQANRQRLYQEVRQTKFDTAVKYVAWEPQQVEPTVNLDDKDIPTHRRVEEPTERRTWAKLVRDTIIGYGSLRNRLQGDMRNSPEAATIWHSLLSLVKLHLRRLVGDARQSLRNQHMKQQLSGLVLMQTASVKRVVDDKVDPDIAVISRAKRAAQNNHVGKAARTLGSEETKQAPPDAQLATLQKLNPSGEVPVCTLSAVPGADGAPQLFDPFAHRQVLRIDGVELVKLVRSANTGAAPGGSGWTEELLLDAMTCGDSASNAIVQETIGAMLCDLARGLAPVDVLDRINAGDQVPLAKPDGGIRPITLGEVFMKMASRIALARDSELAAKHFGEIQKGVNCAAGCDGIVHTTRDFVRSMSPEGVVFTIDFANAFNTPSRQAMWDEARAFPNLRALFYAEYARHTTLRLKTLSTTLRSERGSRQGTTGGPAFFCLALHPVLVAANKIDGVRVRAFMDDITVLATSAAAAQKAWETIRDGAAKLGLIINEKKCEALVGDKVDAAVRGRAFLGKEVRRVVCLKVLGASIARTNDIERADLEKRFDGKFVTWFRRIRKSYGPWASAVLAASGVPKLTYLLRTHHPDVTVPLARKFDGDIRTTWSEWAQCNPDDVSRAFAHLPTSMGGVGFAEQVQVAKQAYEASYEEATRSADKPPGAIATQRQRLHDVNAAVANFIDQSSPFLRRLRALNSQPGTAVVLRDPTCRASPPEWSAALRMRLVTPLAGSALLIQCPGCPKSQMLDWREWLAHAASCPHASGFNTSSRHACLKAILVQIIREVGIQVDSAEPRDLRRVVCPGCKRGCVEATFAEHAKACQHFDGRTMSMPRGSGPDLRLYAKYGDQDASFIAVDVTTVTCNTAAASAHTPQALFDARVREKNEKYQKMVQESQGGRGEFVVFAISENGTLSKQAGRFLDWLAERGGLNSHELRKRVQARQQAATGWALVHAEMCAGFEHRRQVTHRVFDDVTTELALTPPSADAAPAVVQPWLHRATKDPLPDLPMLDPAVPSSDAAATMPVPVPVPEPTPIAQQQHQQQQRPTTPPPPRQQHHQQQHARAGGDDDDAAASSTSTTTAGGTQHRHRQCESPVTPPCQSLSDSPPTPTLGTRGSPPPHPQWQQAHADTTPPPPQQQHQQHQQRVEPAPAFSGTNIFLTPSGTRVHFGKSPIPLGDRSIQGALRAVTSMFCSTDHRSVSATSIVRQFMHGHPSLIMEPSGYVSRPILTALGGEILPDEYVNRVRLALLAVQLVDPLGLAVSVPDLNTVIAHISNTCPQLLCTALPEHYNSRRAQKIVAWCGVAHRDVSDEVRSALAQSFVDRNLLLANWREFRTLQASAAAWPPGDDASVLQEFEE